MAVQRKKPRERIWSTALYAIISSGPAFFVGCTLGFPSAVLIDLDFNSQQSDLFGALAPIGALFGSLLGGFFADYLGRKPTLLLVAVPYSVGYLLITYAQLITNNTIFMTILFTGRFFTGISLGWSCLAVPVYHAEISSAKVRGLFCSFTQLFLSTGLVFIYLLSTVNNLHYYDCALILVGVLAALEILMYFVPESPRWLIANQQKALAVRTLKVLRGPHFSIEDELDSIDLDLQRHPHTNFLRLLHEMITKKAVMFPVLIILIIMCLQQMSGLNASSAYASVIFKDAGVTNPAETASYAVGGVGIFFTFLSIFLVDCLGRKVLLVLSGIGMLIGTLMLGTHFYVTRPAACINTTELISSEVGICNSHIVPLAIVSLIIFNAAFSIGWGPVPWVLLGELLPMRVRGIGSAMANFVNWGSAAIVTGCYFKYSELVNTWFAWWTFSVFNFCGILFVIIFLKETKKKALEDIN